MENLLRSLRDAASEGARRPVAEVLAELTEAVGRYGRVPFGVGDMVTPRAGGDMVGAGVPHVVLEVYPEPHVVQGAPFSNQHLARLDMRVATLRTGQLASYAVEAWTFREWTEADRVAAEADELEAART